MIGIETFFLGMAVTVLIFASLIPIYVIWWRLKKPSEPKSPWLGYSNNEWINYNQYTGGTRSRWGIKAAYHPGDKYQGIEIVEVQDYGGSGLYDLLLADGSTKMVEAVSQLQAN